MKKLFVICFVSSLFVASRSYADEPIPHIREIRREVGELRLLVDELSRRLTTLEGKLSTIEAQEQQLLPWQREQPFFWDGINRRWRQELPGDHDVRLPPPPKVEYHFERPDEGFSLPRTSQD